MKTVDHKNQKLSIVGIYYQLNVIALDDKLVKTIGNTALKNDLRIEDLIDEDKHISNSQALAEGFVQHKSKNLFDLFLDEDYIGCPECSFQTNTITVSDNTQSLLLIETSTILHTNQIYIYQNFNSNHLTIDSTKLPQILGKSIKLINLKYKNSHLKHVSSKPWKRFFKIYKA